MILYRINQRASIVCLALSFPLILFNGHFIITFPMVTFLPPISRSMSHSPQWSIFHCLFLLFYYYRFLKIFAFGEQEQTNIKHTEGITIWSQNPLQLHYFVICFLALPLFIILITCHFSISELSVKYLCFTFVLHYNWGYQWNYHQYTHVNANKKRKRQ